MFYYILEVLQLLIDFIGAALNAFAQLFPPSPFQVMESSAYSDLIAKINYFIPVYEFVAILEAWIVAVAGFYAVSVVARKLGAIE